MSGRMYMLDTNIVIDIFRGNIKTLSSLSFDTEEIVISCVAYGELVYGAENSNYKSKHLNQIDEFVQVCKVFSVTKQTADVYGRIKAALKISGKPIPENDVWIAAHAIESDSFLVTKDSHFSVVNGLKLMLLKE